MSCCSTTDCLGTSQFFSRWSKRYAKKFKRRGLEKLQKLMLEGVRKEPVASKEVLDIGCGVGALHLTLLKEGASRATGVDLSEAMIEEARRFGEGLGIGGKASYVVGDFVQVADGIAEADITVLDKVVCCYENVQSLVEKSTAKTRKVYAVSHPKDIFLMKALFKTQIFFSKLFRTKFIPSWHNWSDVRRMISQRGFEPMFSGSTVLWSAVVYRRA